MQNRYEVPETVRDANEAIPDGLSTSNRYERTNGHDNQ